MTTDITVHNPFADFDNRVADALNMVTSGVSNPEQWLIDALGGGQTSLSGSVVNVDSVLGIPGAWNSANKICGHIGVMPKEVRQRKPDGGSELLWNSPAYQVCNMSVGDNYTPYTFWQTMQLRALLVGNGYAFISRDGNGQPTGMTLLDDNAYTVMVDGKKWVVVYFTDSLYTNTLTPELKRQLSPWANASPVGGNGSQYVIPDTEIFHLHGIGWNGLWGLPMIALAKDTFGVDLSGLEAVSYQFANGGRPGLLLTAPRGIFPTEEKAAQFMAQFNRAHSGSKNTGRTGLLREGMTATTLDASPVDGGLSQLRQYSKDDIALLFGTEYLMGQSSAVYKDLPSRMSAYITNTLNLWMESLEQEGNRKLLTTSQVRRGQFFHVDPRPLLRGSPNDLATYTGALRTQGLISGNEGREMHHFNPVPELKDDYGNPNTSSPDAEPEPEETDEQSTPEEEHNDEPENFWRDALAHNFKTLIRHEARRIKNYSKAEDFIGKAAVFYERHAKVLRETCQELSLDESLADKYVEESKTRITEILGCTGPSSLVAEVADMVDGWESRSGEFVR